MDWMHVWCWTRLESPFCISCGFFAANFRMGGSRCGKFIVQIKWEPCPAVVLVNSAIFFKFPFPSFKAEEQTTKTTSSVPLKNFFVKTITVHLGIPRIESVVHHPFTHDLQSIYFVGIFHESNWVFVHPCSRCFFSG